jgi:AraC family transcriptional regulator
MAALCGISERTFHRRYRDARGEGPGAFLGRLRYDEAKRLMLETAYTVAHIAPRVGFRSVSSFAAGFRQREGMSPAQWRRLRRAQA